MTLAGHNLPAADFRDTKARALKKRLDPKMRSHERIERRSPIERFAWIAWSLRQGYRLNARRIASQFEITIKTAYRDIEFLKDRLGYVIEWDPYARTYKLSSAPEPRL